MTCLRAYRELTRLQLEGWLVEIRAGLAGDTLVIACMGDREIKETGACVADVAETVLEQAHRWRPPSPLPIGA